MEYKTLIRKLEEIRETGDLDRVPEILFLYILRKRETGIPKKQIEAEIRQVLQELFGDEFFSVKREKIKGVGCSGDYPFFPHDFLTPLAWRREEYECQQEYKEYFEDEGE